MARCTFGASRSRPKTQRPMNVASSMNAPSPSIASGEPKTSPTYLENDRPVHAELELLTRPVATPIAKLIRNSVPKKRVSRSHLLVALAVPERLHHREQRREPERQRHEDEVEQRRERELPARELESGVGNRCHVAAMRKAPAPGPIAITSSSPPSVRHRPAS